jgi:hypothetical protein
LSLFDGTKTLRDSIIVATANNSMQIGEYFVNRPTRIRYNICFSSLTKEEIEDVLKEELSKEALHHIEKTVKYLSPIKVIYDLLFSLISEINRWHNLDFDDIVEPFNVKMPLIYTSPWIITVEGVTEEGLHIKKVLKDNWDQLMENENFHFGISFSYDDSDLVSSGSKVANIVNNEEDEDEDEEVGSKKSVYFNITKNKFEKFMEDGSYVFKSGNWKVIAKKETFSMSKIAY